MQVEACMDFPFSLDGINQIDARRGEVVDVPDRLVPGLIAAGYCRDVREVGARKSIEAAEENKALFAAPENKAEGRRRKARMPQNEDEGGLD